MYNTRYYGELNKSCWYIYVFLLIGVTLVTMVTHAVFHASVILTVQREVSVRWEGDSVPANLTGMVGTVTAVTMDSGDLTANVSGFIISDIDVFYSI